MPKIPEYFRHYPAKPDESLFEHTQHLLNSLEKLKSICEIPYVELIEYACIYHDIGKMNPLFTERLRGGGRFDEKKEIGHNLLSLFLFYYLKEAPNLDVEDFNIVAYAILNHHFYVDNFELLSDPDKEVLIEENLSLILSGEDGEHFEQKNVRRKLSQLMKLREQQGRKLILVKGFLHRCDYSASAHTEIENGSYNLRERLEGLHYIWNDMQIFAEENKNKNLILIASTGYGKTEAALKWVDNHKGFYVLPLRTAINSMYTRLRRGIYPDTYMNQLALLHGDMQTVYLSEYSKNRGDDPGEESKVWDYMNDSRKMSLPLTLCTPDQLFKFVFKYPGYEMPLSTYSYSKIVIDEIQAYNSRILAFSIYGLHRILEMGGKLAVITATLSPFIRDLLLKEPCSNPMEEQKKHEFVEGTFLNPKIRHRLKLFEQRLEAEDIIAFYDREKHRDTLKILVVMNTVKEAQELYRNLEAALDEDVEVHLIHARYIGRDRAEKEKAILKDGDYDCKKHVIWISTQIVEASLDIDFDVLFTEYTELNSLFQRLGRVNRAGRKVLNSPNAFIYLQIREKYLNHRFIDEHLHHLGKSALQEWSLTAGEGDLSEEDKLHLIETAYSVDHMERSDFMKNFKQHYEEISRLQVNSLSVKQVERLFRDIFSIKVIPRTVYNEHLYEIQSLDAKIKKKRQEILEMPDTLAEEAKSKKNSLRFEILELTNRFRDFTVNVGYFKSLQKSELKLLCGEELRIVDGRYDYGQGFDPDRVSEEESIFI